MDAELASLFEFVENIQQKQRDQKARGLNDYNMVNVVRKAHAEVGMHSNVIYSLLNPDGLHYQGRLFLDIFIEEVLGIPIDSFGEIVSVQAEEPTQEKRRVDFTIKSENFFVGIEMKVNAKDLKNQIVDYHKHLSEEAQNDNNQEIKIYYLSKDGKAPSHRSAGGIKTRNISFKKEIIKWIDLCHKEVCNISNLAIAFDNYRSIVNKITKNYKGNVMNVAEELVKPKSKEKLKTAVALAKEMKKAKGLLLNRFFDDVRDYVLSIESTADITEISDKISNADMVLDANKCERWFETNKEVERNVGLFFSTNTSNVSDQNLCFYIMVASEHLHYGLVAYKQSVDSNQYILEETHRSNALDKLFNSGGGYREWKSIKWYSYDGGAIKDLNDKAVDLLFDFQGSSHARKILSLLTGQS